MIVGIGVDRVAVPRFARLLATASERTLLRLLRPEELAYCRHHAHPAQAMAARWAAKEAVAKCLGTGFAAGVTPSGIEVERTAGGAVRVRLLGETAEVAACLGIARIHVSMSHDEAAAVAFAVAESAT